MHNKILINLNVFEQIDSYEQFLAYLCLAYVHHTYIDYMVVHPQALLCTLTRNNKIKKALVKSVVTGLNELQDKGIISFTVTGGLYAINVANLCITDSKRFFTISSDEVASILHSDLKCKYRLLYFFATLISNFVISKNLNFTKREWSHRAYCNYSLNYMAEQTGLSPVTISNYLQKLEELKLIYIYKFKAFRSEDGEIIKISNLYCRYHDKENIDFVVEYIKTLKQDE